MFKQLDTILLFVENVQASKAWYQQFLSLDPIEDLPDFVSFRIGSTHFNLHLADALSPVSTGGSVAYWQVENLELALIKAQEMGGTLYRGPLFIKETGQTMAQLRDPHGNVFGLINLSI
jgi:predicted enzyme related to lactoylglutathione lyase